MYQGYGAATIKKEAEANCITIPILVLYFLRIKIYLRTTKMMAILNICILLPWENFPAPIACGTGRVG